MENFLIGIATGLVAMYLQLLLRGRLITEDDRMLLKYIPGTGKKISDTIYWTRDPQRNRADSTIIEGILDRDAINYNHARVIGRKLIPAHGVYSTHYRYEVEYWD